MHFIKTLVTSALLTGAPLALNAAPSLLNLVGDQAPLVVSFHDIPDLRKNWALSPWAKTWNDEKVKQFFAPLRAEMNWDKLEQEVKTETGYTLEELIAFATGDAILAIPTADFDFEAAQQTDEFPLLIAVELGANAAKVEKLLADSREKHPETTHETEDYAGVTIHLETKPADASGESSDAPDAIADEQADDADADSAKKTSGPRTVAWAIADDTWLVAFSKPTLLAAVDALKKGGAESPYGSSIAFLAAQEKSGGAAHVRFMLNFAAVIPKVQQLVAARSAAEAAPNPFLNPAAIIPALGLDAWNQLSFSLNLSERETLSTGSFTFSEERGLLKMISYGEGPVARPAFVPAKAITAQSVKFSLKNFYNGLEEMLGAYNPGILGMGQMYLQNFNKQLGIDIKRDFFGSFGDDLIAVMAPRPGASATAAESIEQLDTLYAFSLSNPQAFQTALDALLKIGGPQTERMITKRDYLGHTVNTFAMPTMNAGQPAQSYSFSVAKNYLFFSMGSPAALESSLQNMAGGGAPFWDRPEVKKAFAQIPANASSFSYQNTSALVGGVFTMLSDLAEKSAARPTPVANEAQDETGAMPARKNGVPVDPSAKPDIPTLAKYWGDAVSYFTRERDGYFLKSTLQHK